LSFINKALVFVASHGLLSLFRRLFGYAFSGFFLLQFFLG
jgi:hypothetical protein